jgi:hypothetical protein
MAKIEPEHREAEKEPAMNPSKRPAKPRPLSELTHDELVSMCHGLMLDNARLNGRIARLRDIEQFIDHAFVDEGGNNHVRA